MKGLAFRKLSRTKSHRNALLRNLVTSLFQHDRIVTTVAKAKEAAREAEKIITLGKRALAAGTVPRYATVNAGLDVSHSQPDASPNPARTAALLTGSQTHHTGKGRQAHINARVYLYSPNDTLPRLFTLAERYAARPGGYTRIHLMGHRKGDHAPRAVLELVDGPRDVRLEMTARSVGRQLYVGAAAAQVDFLSGSTSSSGSGGSSSSIVGREPTLDAAGVEKVVKRFLTLTPEALSALERLPQHGRDKQTLSRILGNLLSTPLLNAATKENLVKTTQFGGREAVERVLANATAHLRNLGAEDELFKENAERVVAAHKAGSAPATVPTEFANVAPRGGTATATPRSADLLVPVDSAYTLSSALSPSKGGEAKTRRRHAGEWRPHALGNTPSSAAAVFQSSDAAIADPNTDSPQGRRLRRLATHGGNVLRVRQGGSESAIALGKGVFSRKRLQRRGLELLGGRRQAGVWAEIEAEAEAEGEPPGQGSSSSSPSKQ